MEPGAKSTKKEIYDGYLAWCEDGGERHRLTMREFWRDLREQGVMDARVGNAKGCAGLRLRTPLDPEPDEIESPVATQDQEGLMSILTLEVVASFTMKQDGLITTWAPGQRCVFRLRTLSAYSRVSEQSPRA